MNRKKILKTIRWCALIPFLILLLYAFFMSLGGNTLWGKPISGFESFILILVLSVEKFWWIFLISIILIICTSISLSSKDLNENPKILKIIRMIAFIPFILLLYVVLQSTIWGEGLIYGIYDAVEWASDPEGFYLFLVAGIIIIVTSIFIRKNKRQK